MATSWKPTVLGRLGYNYGQIKGYSESDFEGGDLRFALGLGGYYDFAFGASG